MDQNLVCRGTPLVPAEYLSLLSVQGQFGVHFQHCMYFQLKYAGIFVLLGLYITGILVTYKAKQSVKSPVTLL